MKRLAVFTTFALVAALSGAALAQQSPPPPDAGTAPPAKGNHMHAFDPQTQLQRLTKQLQLTPDQQAKIGPMLQQRDQQLQAVHTDASLKPADRRAKTMSIVQDSESQIGAVLTPAQLDKWKAMREKAMERMQEKHSQTVPSSPSSNGG
jgi:Spy/CpxP family protein refolding chaperone